MALPSSEDLRPDIFFFFFENYVYVSRRAREMHTNFLQVLESTVPWLPVFLLSLKSPLV